MPASLSYGYRFRDGTVSRYGALATSAATYTDGMRALTVYQTPSSKMAFPRVGMPVKLEAAEARLLDLGYVRVLIWQWRGGTLPPPGSPPGGPLRCIAPA